MQINKSLALIAFFILSLGLKATTYYVATTGDDLNAGTQEDPWGTIQFALDQTTAGDTVAVMGGTYNERIAFNQSGVDGAPIVLTNVSGEVAIIDGTGTSAASSDALVEIFDQSYIVVNGLHITNNIGIDAQGILVGGNCQGITISNNEVSQINYTSNGSSVATPDSNAQPIIVYGSDGDNAITGLIITGNNIHDCDPGYSEGLAVNGNVDGFEITNNEVSNITNIGIDVIGGEGVASANDQARNGIIRGNDVQNCLSPYATAAGIYIDGAANITVERNLVVGGQWGIEVGAENPIAIASGNVVKNNFIYNNADAAIAVGGYDYPANSGKVTSTTIRNNTCLSNDATPGGIGGQTGQIFISYVEDTEIFNNIFLKTNGSSLMLFAAANQGTVNLSLHHNIYYSTGNSGAHFEYFTESYDTITDYQAAQTQDLNSFYANPVLQSIMGGVSFHLANNTSPAINAGDPNTSIAMDEVDGYGDMRIEDDTIDIGADEYNGVLPVTFIEPLSAWLTGEEVALKWHTAEEIQNDRFEIERSVDLQSWQTIERVAAKGFSAKYEVMDKNPASGQNYYRLLSIDLDGTQTYSAIEAVTMIRSSTLISYPNPVRESLRISGIVNSINSVFLIDLQGKVQRVWKNVSPHQSLEITGITPGIYALKLIDQGSSKIIKIAIE
ncbi:MAG: T9SS type A sorting domain-containing protein [Saprospiraceae bacterium]|nr:T9SS type A sorting domain-containing protein [Saprospiraceae bacterium]